MEENNINNEVETKNNFLDSTTSEQVVENTPVVEEQNNASTTSTQSVEEKSKKKKGLGILFGCLGVIVLFVLIIIGVIVFLLFFNKGKISWDNSYLDKNVNFVEPIKLKLGVTASDDVKTDEIKYEATCGDVISNGKEVIWDLTKADGKCEIKAIYKNKKIKKNINVLRIDDELSMGERKINEDSDEDLDYDGLTNKQEKENGTNPLLADTDEDGLIDSDEVNMYKTNPLEVDTDNDGLTDYNEIKMELNPLEADSKSDGIKDGDRTLTYNYTNNNVTLSVKGKGNLASATASINKDTKISNKNGMLDGLYLLYTEGTIDEASLSIRYTDEELNSKGINEDHLSIYYYNTETAKYEKIESTVDKATKTINAKIKGDLPIVLGDDSLVKELYSTQVLFLLDNSWSMYSNEQYKQITGEDYKGGLFSSNVLDGNDTEGLRFKLTGELIDKLSDDNYSIGLSEFRQDYANIYKIGSSKSEIKDKLNNMNGNFVTQKAGTYIYDSLISGLSDFTNESDNKVIVILTDGEDTSFGNKRQKVIDEAIKKGVNICSIGFGEGVNNDALKEISTKTGCNFFSSSDSDGLYEVFNSLSSEIKDNLVDVEEDGKVDGVVIADTGFVVNRDGFSFRNYASDFADNGICYGIATFAEFYYLKNMKFKYDERTYTHSYTGNQYTSYKYDITDIYLKQYKPLYDYRLNTNDLKYTFGFDYFDENDQIQLIREDKGNGLYGFKSEVREKIEKTGIYDFHESDITQSKKEQIKQYGKEYTKKEYALLSYNKFNSNNTSLNNKDKQLLNAFTSFYVKQFWEKSVYSSSGSFALGMATVSGKNTNTQSVDDVTFMETLTTRLKAKDPVVISADFNGGWHAVNAISLVQDVKNPNKYYIGVYDNNHPGEKRYVELVCMDSRCTTRSNKYYSKGHKPIEITSSLANDLEYFNE